MFCLLPAAYVLNNHRIHQHSRYDCIYIHTYANKRQPRLSAEEEQTESFRLFPIPGAEIVHFVRPIPPASLWPGIVHLCIAYRLRITFLTNTTHFSP